MAILWMFLFMLQITSLLAMFKYVIVKTAGQRQNIGIITINNPATLNALNNQIMLEIAQALDGFEDDDSISVIIITGNQMMFSSGIEVTEMISYTYPNAIRANFLGGHWNRVAETIKPVIAAVNGICLGGGLELALMCDIIYAGEKAIFSFPEILMATMPGNGGTQRLARRVGKSWAMEMALAGQKISVEDAEKMGLINRIFPVDKVLDEAVALGEAISHNSQLVLGMVKETINVAFETTLEQGLVYEKRMFHGTLATVDHFEGMLAFLENRPANYTGQ